MGRLQDFRERLVLGSVHRQLDGGEAVLAWTHAKVPGTRAPAVLVVTDRSCLLHVASAAVDDVCIPLSQLSTFRTRRRTPETAAVQLCGDGHEVEVELSLTHRTRSRAVGRVLAALTRHNIAGPDTFNPALTSPLPPMVRNVRHHARRALLTVVGVVVLLLSLVFASPFVPGPGALTAVAGIAILAREYEWARDLHVWAARMTDRFISWTLGLRRRRREAREPVPAWSGAREDDDRDAYAEAS